MLSLDAILVLVILLIALVLFITEWIRMDVVALMVLSALALLGIVSPTDALTGFSNPAVVSVWAMFIISEGLSRAGFADMISRGVLNVSGSGEASTIATIMIVSGVLSGFMNNIGVAALMLPVVIDVARRTHIAASKLLMPLAFGSLLGGLTTLIGTSPNLLVSNALVSAGFQPYSLFDFTPMGAVILLTGTLFVSTIGRHLLPADTAEQKEFNPGQSLRDQYGLQERMFVLKITPDSVAVGKPLSATGLTDSAGLIILALMRKGKTLSIPNTATLLQANDLLLVQGRLERFDALKKWSELTIERESPILKNLLAGQLQLFELQLSSDSSLVGQPVRYQEFIDKFNANIIAIRRGGEVWRSRLRRVTLAAGDHLLLQCNAERLADLKQAHDFESAVPASEEDLAQIYQLSDRVFVIHVPKESELAGQSMRETRLAEAFDFRLLALFREGELNVMPAADLPVAGGDLLIVQGRHEDVDVLRAMQALEIQYDASAHIDVFDSDSLQMIEATLHPHSSLAGKTIGELEFKNRYLLEIVAIWRNGKPIRSELSQQQLQIGDAILMLGPRERLALIDKDADFISLTPVTHTPVDTRKAPIAGLIMLAVIVSVLLNWLPIAIAAIAGVTLMLLTKCLSMDAAYRSIEWRAIFLIAGMLPLGNAMQQTGAAQFVANLVMGFMGQYGGWAVVVGLYAVTAVATMIVPTAALVLIMSPIVISASQELGISVPSAMMAMAIAASASFTSPISHPANVLVMGPGGYRFIDYIKLGVPLTLLVFVVVLVSLPWFWPIN